MPIYTVETTPHADRQIKKLAPPARVRVDNVIRSLASDPRQPGVEKMAGADLYKVRAGRDYRIVFEIHDDRLIVVVVKVGDRKDVYKRK